MTKATGAPWVEIIVIQRPPTVKVWRVFAVSDGGKGAVSSDATVSIGVTFFPFPSFGRPPFACELGLLLFIGALVVLVVGLVRTTDDHSPEAAGR